MCTYRCVLWWVAFNALLFLAALFVEAVAQLVFLISTHQNVAVAMICFRITHLIPTGLSFLVSYRISERVRRQLLWLDGVATFCYFLAFASAIFTEESATFPGLSMFVGGLLTGLLLIETALLLLLCFLLHLKRTFGAARAFALRAALAGKGYDWLTHGQCLELWEEVGERAFMLPPWPDVGILPGQEEGNLLGLIEVTVLRKKLRRG